MSQDFSVLKLLKDIADAAKTGHLEIAANSITWDLYLVEGKLQYAYHSLQSVDNLKHYLIRFNHSEAAQIIPTLTQDIVENNQSLLSLSNSLVKQNYLTNEQKTVLLKQLSQDALESCLWLTEGESQWNSTNPLQSLNGGAPVAGNLLALPPLLEALQTKLQAWQKLTPVITSPYQRPLCVNPALLQHEIATGTSFSVTLEKLVKFMRGATIQQLSLFLKQDDLKVAQLLFPYIKRQILQLLPPKPPLDRLPQIPPFQPQSQPNTVNLNSLTPSQSTRSVASPSVNSQPSTTAINSPIPNQPSTGVETKQQTYKIVCIDDSPTMLDTIKTYLGKDYEVSTVEDPMKSLPSLFATKPDLILMDFSMPGINGNRLCQILKSSSVFKHTPIVIVSGNTKMIDEEKVRAIGASDFLPKPFTREELLAMIEKYLISN